MRRALPSAVAAGVVGLVAWAAGFAGNARQALFSYLAAYVFAVSVVLGALLLLAIGIVTGAGWFVVLRRRAEDVTSAMPALVVLFAPIALGLGKLYPWAAPPSEWSDAVRTAVLPKHAYLNAPAFLGRSAFYLLCWLALAEGLRRVSLRHDKTGDPGLLAKQRALATAALPIVAFTLTFAAFDWVMSLDPTWSSTVFGIYLFGGGFGAAVGVVALVAFGPWACRVDEATPEHAHALGRILLTFVIFWAYIAFSQYLLIWIADLPREIGWIYVRTTGSWRNLAVGLAIGHFALPFFALLSKSLKRRPRVLAAMGAWMVVAHYADVYWMTLPELAPQIHLHWLDLAAVLGTVGATAAVALVRARYEASVPVNDPRLGESLRYEAAS